MYQPEFVPITCFISELQEKLIYETDIVFEIVIKRIIDHHVDEILNLIF